MPPSPISLPPSLIPTPPSAESGPCASAAGSPASLVPTPLSAECSPAPTLGRSLPSASVVTDPGDRSLRSDRDEASVAPASPVVADPLRSADPLSWSVAVDVLYSGIAFSSFPLAPGPVAFVCQVVKDGDGRKGLRLGAI